MSPGDGMHGNDEESQALVTKREQLSWLVSDRESLLLNLR